MIIERIHEILKDTGISTRKFELSIGKSSGYLNTSNKSKSDVGAQVILSIIKKYPEYNLIWLMTGEGDMKAPNELKLAAIDDLADGLKVVPKNEELQEEFITVSDKKFPIVKFLEIFFLNEKKIVGHPMFKHFETTYKQKGIIEYLTTQEKLYKPKG